MPRLNLRISDDLHQALAQQARKAGLSDAAYARECLARQVGRDEARDELQERLAAVERVLARLRRSPSP